MMVDHGLSENAGKAHNMARTWVHNLASNRSTNLAQLGPASQREFVLNRFKQSQRPHYRTRVIHSNPKGYPKESIVSVQHHNNPLAHPV